MATNILAHQQTAIHPRPQRHVGMQRCHFRLIAEIISKELEGEASEKAAYAFAYILPVTNVRFDSQCFLKACRVKAFTEGDNQ
jgi:hypothetical protein